MQLSADLLHEIEAASLLENDTALLASIRLSWMRLSLRSIPRCPHRGTG